MAASLYLIVEIVSSVFLLSPTQELQLHPSGGIGVVESRRIFSAAVFSHEASSSSDVSTPPDAVSSALFSFP